MLSMHLTEMHVCACLRNVSTSADCKYFLNFARTAGKCNSAKVFTGIEYISFEDRLRELGLFSLAALRRH